MGSCLLFHGPGAKTAAVDAAYRLGTLVHEPIGDDETGLKVDDARLAVSLLGTSHLGAAVGVVVIGPLDGASSSKTSDTLLKSIEEFNADLVQPILWARDLGGVPLTIRSRCLEHFAPPLPVSAAEDGDLRSVAWALVEASKQKNIPALLEALKGAGKKDASRVLEYVIDCIQSLEGDQSALWERIRPITMGRTVTLLDLMAVLC